MSVDYNSKLIASLYEETNEEKATEISDEMIEIGDPIFIHPIYSAFKKFKNTSVSHYFVSDLAKYKNSDAAELLKNIALDPTVDDADIEMMIGYLADINYQDPIFVERVRRKVIALLTSNDDKFSYQLTSYLDYLKKIKLIGDVVGFLEPAFLDEGRNLELRKIALAQLLRANPEKYIQYFYDNYNLIKGKKSETIFAKEISGWKGEMVVLFWEKIIKEGSPRAKEIVEAKINLQKKSEEIIKSDKNKAIESKFSNADILSEISKLRTKINTQASTDPRFNLVLLSPSESLYQQNEVAQSKHALVGCCMDLRSVIQGFEKIITSSEFSIEEAGLTIPDVRNIEGSLNKFHLYLVRVKIPVDSNVYGLRNLNRIVSKLAHPEHESEVLNLLKTEGLVELYKSEDWGGLHRKILEMYRDVLVKISEAIGK